MLTGSTALIAENAVLKARVADLEKALRAMSDMYGYVWDRVDGALVCMPQNVARFDAAHEQAQRALMESVTK